MHHSPTPNIKNRHLSDLLINNIFVFCAYLLTAWLGLSVPFANDKVTLFWLPSGIAVAALYRWGWKLLPSIFLAALTINLLTGANLLTNILIATGNSAGPFLTLLLFRYWQCNLYRLHKYTAIKFILIAALGMTIPAVIGSSTLAIQHSFHFEQYWKLMTVWWMGDSLGVFLAAPLLANLSLNKLQLLKKNILQVIFFTILIIITGLICFPLNQFNNGDALPIVFITFVAVTWATLSFGLIGGALSSLCFSFIAIWATTHNMGPFIFSNLHVSYWVIWIYILSMTLLCMMITATHSEILDRSDQLSKLHQDQEIHKNELENLNHALASAAVDSASTSDFFISLLNSLAEALDADHVMISMVNEDQSTATTHTYLSHNQLKPNFTYKLDGTPCDNVMENSFCFITQNVQQLYPQDAMLQHAKIESYIGMAIQNIQGNSIGILIALSTKPIPLTSQLQSLLKIYANRIAGEIRKADDQEKIFNLAFYDALTKLPNRRLLQERLQIIAAQSERNQQFAAILFIDIDHFKFLNDSRGHHIGDQLLVLVSQRISSIIRSTDLAARLGGDEFVVIFENLGRDPDIAAIEAKKRAEELHSLVNLPYSLENTVHHCTISIGVSIFQGKQRSIEDLLRHADLAMYQAKDSGRNAIRFFDPTMQLKMEARSSIENDLREALENDEQLVPYYQIQVNADGMAIGAELLLRWIHPTKGMISPADFIPVAEQTGLIIAIGQKVLIMACKQLRKWKSMQGFEPLKLAVNVSPVQFNQKDFVLHTLSIVKEMDIDPHLLTLELTEGSLLQNIEQSIEKMHSIKSNKLQFAMDDFGIGYSSLSYLKKLPLDQLKIDQSFVRDISTDPNDRVIVRTIIAMAQNMELEVLAEGVETEEQKHYLLENGCKKFQGYYFGKPAPIDVFEQQLNILNNKPQ